MARPINAMTRQMQDYSYDTANRLIGVVEHDNNMQQTLQRSVAYDRYGNMWITQATGVAPGFRIDNISNLRS